MMSLLWSYDVPGDGSTTMSRLTALTCAPRMRRMKRFHPASPKKSIASAGITRT
jgi:hypothetical protein